MGIRLRSLPKFQFLTDAGAPGNGYKVHCYLPGTSTYKDTYTDYTGGTPNANPVILNARGEADIWFNGIYKLLITDANDVEVYTVDNYGEGEDSVLTGNYVKNKNGGFEADTVGDGIPDDWTVTEYDATSTVAIDATDQIEGLNSLKFTSTGLGGGYADSDYFEVRASMMETVTFSIKSSVVDVRNVVDILWYTAAKSLISTSNIYDDSATNPTSWTQKNGTATAPATARYAKVRVIGCHSSDATNGSTWFDDIRVISAATTTEYGVVERATQAEVDAGADTGRYVTPETLLAAATPGKLVKISTATISADATVDFTGIDDTYGIYYFVLEDVIPATDSTNLHMLVAHDAVPTWETTSYFRMFGVMVSSTIGNRTYSGSAVATELYAATGVGNTAAGAVSGIVEVLFPADTGNVITLSAKTNMLDALGVFREMFCVGSHSSTSAVTSVRFVQSSGNLASGTITLYGLVR